jgi:hypothetical protein
LAARVTTCSLLTLCSDRAAATTVDLNAPLDFTLKLLSMFSFQSPQFSCHFALEVPINSHKAHIHSLLDLTFLTRDILLQTMYHDLACLLLPLLLRQYPNATTISLGGTAVTASTSQAPTQSPGRNGTSSTAHGTVGTVEAAEVGFANLVGQTQFTIQSIQNGMNASTANSSNSVYAS